MTDNLEKAKEEYGNTADNIITFCDVIRECYSSTPRNVNWGHVGTAYHVANLLCEILDFIGKHHD